MANAAAQKSAETNEDIRESTLSGLQSAAELAKVSNNPFNGSTGVLNPYHDEDTWVNLQLVSKLLVHTPHPIIISGVAGSGKSTFLRLFVRQFEIATSSQGNAGPGHENTTIERDLTVEPGWQIIKFKATARSKPGRLIKQISSTLGFEKVKTGPDLCQMIIQQRISERQRPIPLLIIDNAHLLSQDSLDLVADLSEHCSSKLHIMLSALPEFQNQFHNENDKICIGRNAHVLNIRPLTLQQTGDYLDRRIQSTGMDVPFTLTDVQIARVHKQSGGIPGEINRVAQLVCQSNNTSLKMAGFIPGSGHNPNLWQRIRIFSNSFSLPQIRVLPLLAVFVTGIVIGLFIQFWSSDSPSTTSTLAKNNDQIINSTDSSNQTIVDGSTNATDELNKVEPGSTSPKTVKTKTVEPKKPVITKKLANTLAKQTIKPDVVAIKKPATRNITLGKITPEITAPVKKTDPEKTKVEVKTDNNNSKSSGGFKLNLSSWKVGLPKIKTMTFQDKKWLLRQNPRHYTIQLLSARRWKTIKQYEKMHKFGQGLAAYQIRYKDNMWHVLTFGNYSSRKKAIQRIKNFPEDIRGNKFRIRKLRYVQREIKRGVILPSKKPKPVVTPRRIIPVEDTRHPPLPVEPSRPIEPIVPGESGESGQPVSP